MRTIDMQDLRQALSWISTNTPDEHGAVDLRHMIRKGTTVIRESVHTTRNIMAELERRGIVEVSGHNSHGGINQWRILKRRN